MRVVLVISLIALAHVARANPRLDVAVRAGVAAGTEGDGESYAVGGAGPFAELEVGARIGAFTVAGFAGYWGFHDATASLDDLPTTTGDLREHCYDVGLRFHYHLRDAFVGAGGGVEVRHELGTSVEDDGQGMHFTDHIDSEGTFGLVELHAGYTFPRVGPLRPQLFAMASYANDEFSTESVRLALGAQF